MSIIEKAIDRLVSEGEDRNVGPAGQSTSRKDVPERETENLDGARCDVSPASVSDAGADDTTVRHGIGAQGSRRRALVADTQGESVIALPAVGEIAGSSDVTQPVVLAIHGLGLEGVISPKTEGSRTAEEFRMIKRPLLLRAFSDEASAGEHPNVIMVTSSVAGEGKTFTSLNLAISIAMEMDRTVLLIDADLASPGLSRLLKAQDLPGMTERLLDDSTDLKSLLLRTDVPKLTLLPAGRPHHRSTELLASNTMKGLFDELATRYPDRVVVFDSPPLLATSEASVLAAQAGQICLVVESATTPQFLVKEALALLQQKDRVSLVLNKTKRELLSGRDGYHYGYRYRYGRRDQRGHDDAVA